MPEEENEESDLKAEADSSEEMGGASKIERADQQ